MTTENTHELKKRLSDLELFRTLLDQSPDAIFLVRLPTGRLSDVNQSACSLLGYAREELLSRSLTDLMAAPESGQIAGMLSRESDREQGVSISVSLVGKDDRSIPADMTLRLVESGGGMYAVAVARDITERRKAEEQLKTTLNQLENIVEFLPDATFIIDADKRIIAWNRAMEEMTGVPKEEILGKDHQESTIAFYGERRPYLMDLLEKDDGEIASKYAFVRRKGDALYAEVFASALYGGRGAHIWAIASPLYDSQGNVTGAIESIRDITDQKLARDALSQSEERYRSLFLNAIEGIFQTTLDGRLIMVNPSLARMLGYDSPRHTMESITDIASQVYVYPEDRSAIIDSLRREGTVTGREVLFRKVDGTHIKVLLNLILVTGDETYGAYIEGSCIDITEKWRAEQALRSSEEKYRAIFENATEGIYQTTPEGRYLSVNNAFARMFGFDSPQDMIDSVQDIGRELYVNPEDRLEMVRRLREHDRVEGYEVEVFRKDRSRFWISINIHTVRDDEGNILYLEGTNVDITRRKQAEEALRASEARYRRLYDTMMDAYVSVSMDGTIQECNDAYLSLLGYSPDVIKGLTYRDITPEKWHSFEGKIIEKEVLARGYSDTYQKEYRKKDGTVIPVELRTYLLRDDGGNPAGMWSIVRDITERKRSEDALKESERHLADIIEFLPDATLVIDRQCRVTAWNRAMEDMTGVAARDMVGKGDYAYAVPFYGEPRPILIDLVLMPKGEVERKYYHIKHRGDLLIGETDVPVVRGEKRFLSGWAHPIYDASGQIVGAIECIRDITDKRRAEEALEQSETLYRLLAENASDMISRHRPDGTILYVTPSCESMLGYTPDEMTGRSASEFTVPEDIEGIWEAFNAARDAGEDRYRHEFRLIRKDGSLMWAETLSRLIRDARGDVVEVQSSIRDISKRREAEEALKENETRYRLLAENASDIIFTMDGDLRFTYISPSVERIRGYTVEEAMKQSIEQALAPGSLEKAILVFHEELEKEKVQPLELWRKRTLELEETCRDGSTIWTETTFSILRDTEKRLSGFLGITRDITERKRSAEEKKRLESQLAQAQKMESIGTLAGGIAHDFNNILAAIIGYSELALDDLASPEKARAEIGEVIKAGDRARDLVSQILTFSRKTETSYSPLALRTIVKESLKMLRSVIPTTIEIRQDLADTGLVMSDPTQVNQILMNLCTNAAHAMEEQGGVLEVKLNKRKIDREVAEAMGIPAGPYLRLTVSDTGHGMPPEVMDKIFEPYFTTKEIGRGTGLGLSVVHGIVRSHGGAVTCSSTPGQGTTFEVFLPEVESGGTGGERVRKEPYQKGTERILFVDDEPTLVSLAEKMLRKMGYQVYPKTDSREALAAFRDNPDVFDLVITDMTMPGIPGDMLARRLMEIRGDIPVILCTGYSERISEEKVRQMGVSAFVQKPFEMRDLARTIRTVLDGKR